MTELVVVGAGVIGLACARRAQQLGWRVTLLDRDFEGDRASHGNAGGIAVSESTPIAVSGFSLKALRWLMDPLGPLAIRPRHAPRLLPWLRVFNQVGRPEHFRRISRALAALNERALADLSPVLDDLGMAGQLHRRGALTVYETDAAYAADAGEWAWKRELGVRWRPVARDELRALEPALAPVFRHAVMLEDWAHVDDPLNIVRALRERIRQDGGRLVTADVATLALDDALRPAAVDRDGRRHAGDRLLVAAGAWSGALARSAGDRVLLESERGYNTTLPGATGMLDREVIFAERKFVATPLAVGLRIGGAAEFAGLDAPPNYRRSDALLALARRYLPGMDERNARRWMGNRPATPDSLPVIGPSPATDRLLYAFGHGHLGLTQAATTGAIVGSLLAGSEPGLDLRPYSISRFNKANPLC
ncbi:NAD(P)/FAD-dependent oxidoreductase [Bordetella bronchialis]|uniref:Amino acid dehydrogenase n=1 Tax=Bordetella bronchialis TaxID=463025 RepID=A0A193FVM3_9BORD|nr:FAD-binding oxidoreductase [Bordetella bronchialis]ANN71084.1 amino acid dehydrogenase [Bordetella bronchialis]